MTEVIDWPVYHPWEVLHEFLEGAEEKNLFHPVYINWTSATQILLQQKIIKWVH